MNKKEGFLSYNYENNRMGVLDSMDLWLDSGLHCGEMFEVFLKDEWVPDRIEMSGSEWYLVYGKLKGRELEGLKVKI